VTLNTTKASIAFKGISNGTYTYAVTVPSGQSATPASGTVAVNGTVGHSVAISVKPSSSPSSSSSVPDWAWAVIGVFVVLTLVFLVTTLMARRKPPTPPAPQGWNPGQTTESQGSEGGPSPPPSS
jgi:hypothetical protein